MTELNRYRTFVPVTSAEARGAGVVRVTLADGRTGRVDFSELIGVGPWKQPADPAFFSLAHAAYDTVVWTDEVDVAPEYVFDHFVPDGEGGSDEGASR